jgi:signal transduction histidine kinase
MNEKILLRFFIFLSAIFAVSIFAISTATQNASDARAEAVLLGLQNRYGIIITQLFKNDALNGNNRSIIQGLEGLMNTAAIDGYSFRSFVSEFESTNISSDSSDYYQNEIAIGYSENTKPAAQIVVYTKKSRLLESKKKIIYLNQVGWLCFTLLAAFAGIFGFFALKRENENIRNFINLYLTKNDLIGAGRLSAIWDPIVETIKISKDKVDKLNRELEKAQVTEAIARTTQMLAHDVRKPFNLFRMTMDRVKSADTPEQMKAILNEAVPEVDRSLASVNGLIADVLNVGAEGSLELKPMRLAPVVDDVVDEVRKLHPKSRLDVMLDVPSELWVQADFTRIPRVLLNILSNAVEAVGAGGHQDAKLWVCARELDGKFVEVRVGNEGSYIAPENLDKLFDLFFTSGKTGGTGLGLAIVKKIVTQHGGTVHCTSERNADFPNGRVEFVFTLGSVVPGVEVPIKAVLNDAAATDISQQTFEIRSDAVPKDPPADVQKPHVVFLDDSPLARWAWENKLKSNVSIRCFDGPKAFFQKIDVDSSNRIDLCTLHTIITDHYFTPDERLTGLELARELRNRGFAGRILLASNGEFSPSELNGIVDKIVDKQPVGWDLLKS